MICPDDSFDLYEIESLFCEVANQMIDEEKNISFIFISLLRLATIFGSEINLEKEYILETFDILIEDYSKWKNEHDLKLRGLNG